MTAAKGAGTDWLKLQSKRVTDGVAGTVGLQEALSVPVEAWLREHGVQYAPPGMIPLSIVDIKRSLGNQARRDPLVQDSVDRFAIGMKEGAYFPPIVAFAFAGKLVIVDGNNRVAAAMRANLTEIFGIVISERTPSETIQRLTVEANAHHGVTPELSWRLEQAFHLISIGYTDGAAAAAAGVSTSQITTGRRLREADERAREMRIPGFESLPATTRGLLAQFKDDPVFLAAAKLVISSEMTIEEVREMIRTVKNFNSEAAKLAAVEGIVQERAVMHGSSRAVGRPVARVNSPKAQLISGSGMILKSNAEDLVRNLRTEEDRLAVLDRVKSLELYLAGLRAAIEGKR